MAFSARGIWTGGAGALLASPCLLTAGPSTVAASGPSDLLDVVQVGTGSGAVTSGATATFVVPFLWDGTTATIGGSIALPTVDAGTQHAIAESGSASSDSELALSADGNYLTLGGYDAPLGTTKVGSTASNTNPRVIARIDAAGNVDTSTALTDAFTTSNFRDVVTDDGTHFWAAGDGGSVTAGTDKNAGVVYVGALGGQPQDRQGRGHPSLRRPGLGPDREPGAR